MAHRLYFLIALLSMCSLHSWACNDDTTVGSDSLEQGEMITDAMADSIIEQTKSNRRIKFNILPQPEDTINTPTHPYYNWKRDFTYAGIPLFISSFIIKDSKKGFRSARFSFEKSFKTQIDNYTQYAPYAVVLGCKLAGYEGRSNWGRFLVSTAFSNMIMAASINSIKYSVKEMRPDNSTKNSFPSGHTATAFTAATILHKEYGLTRSPWFSVGGYAVATATGVMRVLNNRHWISDVMAGAGIGILSTELGYFAADLIFKNKGIKRFEIDNLSDPEHPSFFDIQMGVGVHSNQIDFTFDDPDVPADQIKLGTSTAFGVETAYFFNKYVGVGVMGRITSTPAKGLNMSDEEMQGVNQINTILASYTDNKGVELPGLYSMYIENGNFNQASLDAGAYFNLPVAKRLTVGAKALFGVRLGDGIRYMAKNGNPKIDDTYSIAGPNGTSYPLYWYEDVDGSQFRSSDLLDPGVSREYNKVLENATEEYEMVRVTGQTAFNYVLGVSATWRYKTNFAWKIFADFDSSKIKYTYTGRYMSDEAIDRISHSAFPKENPEIWNSLNQVYTGHATHMFNLFTFGGSFSVNF